MQYVTGVPVPLARLIEQLSGLPGIGQKTAMRLAMSLLEKDAQDVQYLAQALSLLHEQMDFCACCGGFAEKDGEHTQCHICQQTSRNHGLLCVVEQAVDVLMLERTQTFRGVYHVLHGRLSPVDGMGEEQLRLQQLDARLEEGDINELILATSATVDGEATAHFIARRYTAYPHIKISRIARGVPEGGELEYLDEYTLSRALDQRVIWNQL